MQVIILILFYLSIAYDISISYPFYYPNIFALLIIISGFFYLTRDIWLLPKFIIYLIILLLFNVFSGLGFDLEKFLYGISQLILSIITVKIVFNVVSKNISLDKFILINKFFIYFILALLFLESNYKNIFDNIAEVIYNTGEKGFKFANDLESLNRDYELIGKRRLSALTAEPSLAGIFLSLLIYADLLLNYSRSKVLYMSILSSVSFYVIGSPFCFIGLAVFLLRNTKATNLLFFAILFFVSYNIFQDRFDNFNLEKAYLTSEAIRYIVPLLMLENAFYQSPFFGIGISNMYNSELAMKLSNSLMDTLGTNALINLFLTLGIPLSIYLIFFEFRVLIRNIDLNYKVLVPILLFSLTIGSFIALKFWSIIVFILIVNTYTNSNATNFNNNSNI